MILGMLGEVMMLVVCSEMTMWKIESFNVCITGALLCEYVILVSSLLLPVPIGSSWEW